MNNNNPAASTSAPRPSDLPLSLEDPSKRRVKTRGETVADRRIRMVVDVCGIRI